MAEGLQPRGIANVARREEANGERLWQDSHPELVYLSTM